MQPEKEYFQSDVESIAEFIENHEEFINAFAVKTVKQEELLKSYDLLPDKKLVFAIDQDVVILNVSLKRGHVSVTTNIVCPTPAKELARRGKEMWTDHYTEEGRTKAEIKQMLATASIDDLADISLFSGEFDYKKKTYLFESVGTGCDDTQIKKQFPKNKPLLELLKLQKKSEKDIDMSHAIWLYSQIKGCDDYAEEVIRTGMNIVKSREPRRK